FQRDGGPPLWYRGPLPSSDRRMPEWGDRMMSNLIAMAATLCGLWPGETGPSAPRNDSICQRDMKADLFFLARDGFRGGRPATAETARAGVFVASRLARLGPKPVEARGGGSFSRGFTLVTASLGPANRLSFGETMQLRSGQGFIPLPFCPEGECRVGGL